MNKHSDMEMLASDRAQEQLRMKCRGNPPWLPPPRRGKHGGITPTGSNEQKTIAYKQALKDLMLNLIQSS